VQNNTLGATGATKEEGGGEMKDQEQKANM